MFVNMFKAYEIYYFTKPMKIAETRTQRSSA